jgi:hypothetical protein
MHPIAIMKEQADNLVILPFAIALIFVRHPRFHALAIVGILGWTLFGWLSAAIAQGGA